MKLSNYSLPITTGRRLAAVAIRSAAFALLVGTAWPLAAQTAPPSKSIQTFLVYYGGGPTLAAGDAQRLAKFDLIDINKYRYTEIGSNTWASVKALNPNVGIYLYELGPEASNYQDTWAQVALYGLGRYNVSRGHSMGSLNGNNPGLFLLDSAGNRVYSAAFSNVASNQFFYLMDFGTPAYQAYWLEAVRADIVNQPWVADGIHADNCLTMASGGGYSATPSKYPTDTAWSDAMNTFTSAISAGLHASGQKLWCNRGSTDQPAGAASWLALDAGPNPPDVVAEEGAFAIMWGTNATRFPPEANWKSQVDTLSRIQNSKVAIFSHTVLAEGQSGTDNWGKPVTFVQSLWYALGSFLLGKNDVLNNAYFAFTSGTNYNNIQWYNEYDKIDLGKAVGPYTVTTIGSVNVYRREFEKGYVYVNPTATDVPSVILPQALQQLTRANLLSPLSSIPSVSSIALNGHNAAILLKPAGTPLPAPDTQAPSVPTGLTGTAVSPTQISLTWNASTDSVGVTGYYVYLNDVALTTTTATSFQHTGLTAGTTYNYRVSAFDAVPNHSAWTAAPVSVTTPAPTPAPDTTAPSTPAGLLASAVSASQINLSWTASTDNVGVTGYRVYRGGVLLATLGGVTAYQSTGLSPSTSYSYTVQAIDVTGNASAQSNSASATTRAAADTVAPSVPTGLKGTAVSPTQINLTWNASTDNVGVTGYYVYLNDVALTTTTTTSFQHTGLTAGTTYNYRVSAFDAVPNHSAWTATPVSVRTTRRRIVGGDFNGDGMSDILWRNGTTGQNAIWFMNGTTLSSNAPIPTVTDLNWSIAGVGDFDGNGKSDILWRNRATGQDTIWLMNGSTLSVSAQLPTEGDLNWSIVGVGDFDGSGKSDILWRHRTTGENAIWLVNGTGLSGGGLLPTEPDLNWTIAGVGDFDGDGKSDILWRHRATGENAIWFVNGTTLSGGGLIPAIADLGWSIAGVGDFNGDGKSDILWRNSTTGENTIWLMNGTTLSGSVQIATQGDLNWGIAGVGDFDSDGKPDILWRNATTGQDAIWLMNGTTLSSTVSITTQAGPWSVALR